MRSCSAGGSRRTSGRRLRATFPTVRNVAVPDADPRATGRESAGVALAELDVTGGRRCRMKRDILGTIQLLLVVVVLLAVLV